jgi:hypothetical protein
MGSITVSIASNQVSVYEGSFELDDSINNPSTIMFRVRDDAGTSHFTKGQPVSITDSVSGLQFTGFVTAAVEDRVSPQTLIKTDISGRDNTYLAQKRTYDGPEFTNVPAGVIFCALLNVLSSEGITAQYASDRDTTATDFNAPVSADTFMRANQSGWGTSSGGETWTHSNGADTLSIASNEGQLVTANNGVINSMQLGASTGTDMIITARMSLSNTSGNIAIIGRYVDTSHWYNCFFSAGNVSIEKNIGGVFTTLATFSPAQTISNGTFFWIKFSLVGTTLQAKCWVDGNSEPANWSGTVTDASLSSGGWALKGNDLFAGALTFKYDHFTVTSANTIGTSNFNDGDLELTLAGSPVTKTETTTSDFNAGTLTNVVGVNNTLTLAPTNTIKFVSQCNGSSGSRVFQQIWTGSYTIVSGDKLSYSMWIADSSPVIQAYVHLHCSNGNNTGGLTDAFSWNEENQDLSGYAKNQWYARTVDLTPIAGGVITNAFVCFDGGSQGTYTAYFHDIKVVNGVTNKLTIFSSTLNSNTRGQNFGYANTQCSVVSAYDPPSGSRISPSTSLTGVGILKNGVQSWTLVSLPQNTSLIISTSFDGGVTWQTQTNLAPLRGVLAGASASGINLLTRQDFAITGPDPTLTPIVDSVVTTINPSYTATKTDVIYTKHTTSDFSAGTLTNVTAQASDAGVTLTGFLRDWNDSAIVNQTLYGNTTPGQVPFHGGFYMSNSGGSDVKARFDFAGNTWNVLDMSISHDIPTSGGTTSNGLVYATTNWGNFNDSYAYAVSVSSTSLLFAKGNNSTSAGAFTQLAVFTFPAALQPNSWHTLRVQWNGTAGTLNGIPAHTHNIYVDGTLLISQVDASYTAAGYVGARMYNNSGGGVFQQGHFDNFSIVVSYSNTTWVSPAYSLNAVGTCGDSLLFWNATIPVLSSILVETSINGGSTWSTASNGGQIPGLSNGVSCIGINLQVRVTFNEGIGLQAIFKGFTAWVMSQFSSSGNRISPALSLATITRLGSSLVAWNSVLPSGCTLGVDTRIDSGSWTDQTAQNGQAVAGLNGQPSPTFDSFDTLNATTLRNYTSTSKTGGSASTWNYDTANSRIVASGGSGGLFIRNYIRSLL